MSHRSIVMSLLIAALALAGCGVARDSVSAPSPAPGATTTQPVTSPTTSAAQPTRESFATAVPSATDAPVSRYADLPQSQTAEGYHVLGDLAAPVAMNHYSDFL